MHRRTMIVIIAICLSVLLTATIAGCSISNNSDGNSNDGGDMMDDGGSGDDMMDDGTTNP